jgi:predicted XRE-type DNA-binding protein
VYVAQFKEAVYVLHAFQKKAKISALKQGKLSGFSIERLMRFLLLLGRDIEITVKGKSGRRSTARLRVA